MKHRKCRVTWWLFLSLCWPFPEEQGLANVFLCIVLLRVRFKPNEEKNYVNYTWLIWIRQLYELGTGCLKKWVLIIGSDQEHLMYKGNSRIRSNIPSNIRPLLSLKITSLRLHTTMECSSNSLFFSSEYLLPFVLKVTCHNMSLYMCSWSHFPSLSSGILPHLLSYLILLSDLKHL